jgi:hypothetical protein
MSRPGFAWVYTWRSKGERVFSGSWPRSPAASQSPTGTAAHTVQITASTLHEAVAPGLAAIRGNECETVWDDPILAILLQGGADFRWLL